MKHKCLPPSARQAPRQVLPTMKPPKGYNYSEVPDPGDYHKSGQTMLNRDLKGASPLREQFEPTPMDPIRQHGRMGGIS